MLIVTVLIVVTIMKNNGFVSMFAISFGNLNMGHIGIILSIILFYLNGLAGSCMILSISGSSTQISNNSFWARLGDALISILGFQFFFIFISDNLLGYNLNYFYSAIISTIILLLCYGLHILVVSISPKLIGK